MTIKIGDKVTVKPNIVALFNDLEGAEASLKNGGTVTGHTGMYIEVKMDDGFTIQNNGAPWLFLSDELEKV